MSNTQENDPASRLIEHTAEKEPKRSDYGIGIFENQRFARDHEQWETKIKSESPEIDKEEEQEQLIDELITHTFGANLIGRKRIADKFTIHRKP